MAKQRKRVFTVEFKADAVRMARAGDPTVPQVAEAIGVSASVLRAQGGCTKITLFQG